MRNFEQLTACDLSPSADSIAADRLEVRFCSLHRTEADMQQTVPASWRTFLRAGIMAATLAILPPLAPPAQAAGVEDFYKGHTLQVVIGYSPGGGYDLYARALAHHIGRHIPGNPTVTAQNMPGAGSLK